MVWVFILGALYGIAFILNIKLCQYDPGIGAVAGIMLTGGSTAIALSAGGGGLSPQQWLIPFLAMIFFFMPNYVTAVGHILKVKT